MLLSDDQLIQLEALARHAACEAAKLIQRFEALARHAACEAAKLIQRYANETVEVKMKPGGASLVSQVVTEVDYKSEALILEHLAPSLTQYDLALLTEEREDDRQRLVKDYFWCIDPLDGTLQFSESMPGYSVSIALVSKAGLPVIGVVVDPVTGNIYSAIKGLGAKRNGVTWTLSDQKTGSVLILPCDFSLVEDSRYTKMIDNFSGWATQQGLDGVSSIQDCGGVLKACKVLENPPACYFKPPKAKDGGGSFWDFAATACIFNELGAIACDYFGEPLDLNNTESTFMNRKGVIFALKQDMINVIHAVMPRE